MAKILLIEDDPFLTTMYKTRFQAAGHEVITASDGEIALAMLRQTPPNLVILDVMLPKIGGFSILEEMQKSDSLKKIPTVVLTNLTDQESIKRAKDLGVKEFLTKAQHTPTEIFEIIKKYLPAPAQSANTPVKGGSTSVGKPQN